MLLARGYAGRGKLHKEDGDWRHVLCLARAVVHRVDRRQVAVTVERKGLAVEIHAAALQFRRRQQIAAKVKNRE